MSGEGTLKTVILKRATTALACLLALALVVSMTPALAFGKSISSVSRAKTLAKNYVGRTAVVTEVDRDYENGTLYYEVNLRKSGKKYELTYRAKDSKLTKYQWEIANKYNQKRTGSNLSKATIKKKAKRYVKGATISSTTLTRDDGLRIYKVIMKKSTKKYTLEYNAKSGKLIEYKWQTVASKSTSSSYIGTTKAKSIAKNRVPGATVRSCKFEKDDGVPTYEVKLIKGIYEYEIVVHAKTGVILEYDRDSIYD